MDHDYPDPADGERSSLREGGQEARGRQRKQWWVCQDHVLRGRHYEHDQDVGQVSQVYFMKYYMMGLLHMPKIMSSNEADR